MLTCCTATPAPCGSQMGPSGSGKTTLLDVLAGRKTYGRIDGDIKFGGTKPTPAFLRRYTGYVEQFDTLIPILTVAEVSPRASGQRSRALGVSWGACACSYTSWARVCVVGRRCCCC